MADRHQVAKLANGKRTAREIADALGCHDGYVRATAERYGLPLARKHRDAATPRPAQCARPSWRQRGGSVRRAESPLPSPVP